MQKQNISTDFEANKCLGALYTGGHVEWRAGLIFTTLSGAVNIVKDGSVLHSLQEEEDPTLMFTTLVNDGILTLVTAHKSSLLRQYNLLESEGWKPDIIKTFRSIHTGPIVLMKLHVLENTKLLATGGADGTIKIWDLDHQYYTHNLKGGSGVCSVIHFHPTKLIVFGGFTMGPLFSWDLETSQSIHEFKGHYSVVTGLQVLESENQLISTGRDKVVILWDLETGDKIKTVPVSGSVEGLHHVNDLEVILAVETKLVRWDLSKPKQVQAATLGTDITKIQSGDNVIYCATQDQNLLEVDATELKALNTVVGNNDEILTLSFVGEENSHIVVGCNSLFLRVYRVSDFSCQLVSGHTDTIMCSNTSNMDRNMIVTGGKDRSLRVWRLENDGLKCLVSGEGHTDPIQGVSFLNQSINTILSVSKDTTIKVWNVDYDTEQISSTRTEIAHEKEINCVCVSPGNELIATGGQDKLGKIWTKDLSLVSTLRGHKRGIWSAQFNPQDQLLATGSGDAIIKIWTLTEFTCIKQLEGQECSVLSLDWINGNQLVSSGSDGLIKVWLVSKEECLSTLDAHSDKVWSIVSRKHEGETELISGSSGGQLVFWKDVTQTAKAQKQEEADKLMISKQKLSNLIVSKQYSKALKLALRLSQPFTALKMLKKLKYEEITEAVIGLNMPEIDQILGYAVKWNSNSKHSEAAQAIIHVILTNHKPDDLLNLSGCRDWVQGLLPYTEKHFERLSRLQMKSKFLVFLQANMKATGIKVVTDGVSDMEVKEEE